MSIRKGRHSGSLNAVLRQNGGAGKIIILLSLAVLMFLIATVGVRQTAAVDCNCGFCHGANHHGDNWTGCSACHDSPPQTGTHLVHYNSTPLMMANYGKTDITSTDGAYQFSCGNCHPLENINHNNGSVDTELYNATSPSGSIKALNPADAAYTAGTPRTTYESKVVGQRPLSYSPGTCSNVYCHSGPSVTSGAVGEPLVDSIGQPILDANGNLTYDPYTVNHSRIYKITPPWGTTGSFTTCTECHEFPLTTSAAGGVQAGVGDSHQWIDDYGYGNLHAYNMGFDPISCSTCHYGTVTQANTWTRDVNSDVTTYNPVPLASRRFHVNGTPDVIFNTTDPVNYYPTAYGLSAATYDPATKTCSSVVCHQNQTKVTWGSPYRWWNGLECDQCHQFSR